MRTEPTIPPRHRPYIPAGCDQQGRIPTVIPTVTAELYDDEQAEALAAPRIEDDLRFIASTLVAFGSALALAWWAFS